MRQDSQGWRGAWKLLRLRTPALAHGAQNGRGAGVALALPGLSPRGIGRRRGKAGVVMPRDTAAGGVSAGVSMLVVPWTTADAYCAPLTRGHGGRLSVNGFHGVRTHLG